MKIWAIACLSVVLMSACEKKEPDGENSADGNGNSENNGGGNVTQGSSNAWFTGTAIPDVTAGREGDFFLNTGTGDLYRKVQDQWTIIMNLRGPAGAAGVAGAKGDTGATGAPGAVGAMGPAGPKGEKGDKGDVGAVGATGAKGATGERGPAGAQGPAGVAGPAGANGAAGENGFDANRLLLTHRHGQAATVWRSSRRLLAGVPSTLEVTYGTLGNGTVLVDIGSKVRCVYRGEGSSSNPWFGSTDFEKGRMASAEKCIDPSQADEKDIADKTERYKKAAALDVTRGVDLEKQESIQLKVISAGSRLSGAKALLLLPVSL